MIIDLVRKFVLEHKIKNKYYNHINHIRLYEEILILVELVRIRGQNIIEAFYQVKDKSLLKQKLDFPKVNKPTNKVVRMKNNFKTQLKEREIQAVSNFKEYIKVD